MKKLAIAVVGIIVILVAAIFIAPSVIDFKPIIASRVKAATGRDLRIDGPLKISLLPALSVSATGVHLSNAPGMKAPEMLMLDAVSLQAELFPLIGGRFVIDNITISNPTVNLEVAKSGVPNWSFGSETGGAPAAPASEPSSSSGGLENLSLGDINVTGGHVTYLDGTTGQTVEAKSITLNATMAAISTPLTLKSQMTLNDEPVTADLAIDSLGKLQQGQQAQVKLAVNTKQLTAGFDGSAQQQPVAGLNGTFDFNVGSVGGLLAWLHRPLDKGQADPGPIKVHAVFASAGAKSELKEATIQGTALKLNANGTIDASGPVNKLSLTVDGGVLDLDRYMPPPRAVAVTTPSPVGIAVPGKPSAPAAKGINLASLRKTDADVKVTLAGVKARGVEIGKLAFTATDKSGVVDAQLSELAINGGTVSGTVKLDATHDAPVVTTDLKIDHVTVDKIAAAADLPIAGVVSATLKGSAQGSDMHAVLASLAGQMALDLGGTKSAAVPEITGVKLNIDVPAPGKAPTVKGSLTYRGQQVSLDTTLGPLQQLADGGKFPAKIALTAPLITVNYDGNLQQAPPALDGTFDLNVDSVAKLVAWLGHPLDPKQADPGLLKVHAALVSDGGKITLKDAAVTGKAIKIAAAMQFDGTQKVPTFSGTLDVQQADLNAYMPSSPGASAPASGGRAPAAPGGTAAAGGGWSSEPFDVAPLAMVNGDLTIKLALAHYRDLDITQGQIKLTISNKVLTVTVDKLALSHGTLDMKTVFDASAAVPKLDYQMTASNVEALQLLKAFADSSRLSGTLACDTTLSGSGRSEKELVGTLNGKGQFKVTNGAIHGINVAQVLRKAGSLGFGGSDAEQTDFAELSGTYTMKDGVLSNSDMKMTAPLVRLSGKGNVPFPPQTIDYTVEAELVASTQGQGSKDSLAGIPIPVKVGGTWANPSYQVDWGGVFASIAKDPERLKNLPAELGGQFKNMGLPVPAGLIPGGLLPGSQSGGQSAPGGGKLPGNVGNALKGLFGK